MDDEGLMRAGLLVNPSSGRGSGKGLALAETLAGDPCVMVRVIEDFARLPEHLREFAGAGVSDIFISSGDGTVQAIQTELVEAAAFPALPRLSLLPHGTTNMTAADLGFRHRQVQAQADFIRGGEARDLRQRHTLRAVNPRDGRPRHGMFLGTGAVAEATLFCQRAFNDKGVKGSWATFATLAAAVGKSLFTRPDPHDLTRFDRPFPITVEAAGAAPVTGDHLFFLATTLDKLILGTRPFWGGKSEAIRSTVIPYPVPSILRWLVPMMYGGENRRSPKGAVSFSARAISVRSPVIFVIDGEFFEPPEHEPLRIEAGPLFTYIRG